MFAIVPKLVIYKLSTLRFMHKWLGMTLFPRPNTRTIREDELKLLFAMVKHRKVSPVKFMIDQWLEAFILSRNIECTSLVTRIANDLDLMETARVEFISGGRPLISYKYFRQGQMLKKLRNGAIV